MEIHRQGDVLLIKVARIPDTAIAQSRQGDIILAYGEVTGHAHRITCQKAQLWNAGAERYLQLLDAAPLTHEEHIAHVLQPGMYHILIQKEYAPGAIRNVTD